MCTSSTPPAKGASCGNPRLCSRLCLCISHTHTHTHMHMHSTSICARSRTHAHVRACSHAHRRPRVPAHVRRFRSKQEVAKALGLNVPGPSSGGGGKSTKAGGTSGSRVPRDQAAAAAREQAASLGAQLPLQLECGAWAGREGGVESTWGRDPRGGGVALSILAASTAACAQEKLLAFCHSHARRSCLQELLAFCHSRARKHARSRMWARTPCSRMHTQNPALYLQAPTSKPCRARRRHGGGPGAPKPRTAWPSHAHGAVP